MSKSDKLNVKIETLKEVAAMEKWGFGKFILAQDVEEKIDELEAQATQKQHAPTQRRIRR